MRGNVTVGVWTWILIKQASPFPSTLLTYCMVSCGFMTKSVRRASITISTDFVYCDR